MNPFSAQIEQLEAKLVATRLLLTDPELASLAEAELTELETQLRLLQEASLQFANPSQESQAASEGLEKANCTIEFRPGTGGDEAKIWANDLLRMYLRFLERTKFRHSFVDEMVIKITGFNRFEDQQAGTSFILSPYEIFQSESGVHRVQRVPATEAQGRIHTSTATVAVLPEVPPSVITIREEELDWQFIRASGAGGQHVNKTSSAVRLVHRPSGLMVTSQQEKRQEQNRKIALDLLRAQLWEIEEEKRLAKLGEARSAIGRARRAEKIRTYNFPQSRVTDHRTKVSWHNLEAILDGELEEILITLNLRTDKAEQE